MLTLDSGLAALLERRVVQLTFCWRIRKRDGTVLRGTMHDQDITIDSGDHAGTYRARAAAFPTNIESKSDGSVTNLELEGGFRVDAEADDVTVLDIESGQLDTAPAVLFMCSWQNPNAGQKILVSGTLGEPFRDSDGRYRFEVRGLTQALRQQILRSYSEGCDVKRFGDDRCKSDVPTTMARTGTVSTVENRKRFTVALDAGPEPLTPLYYVHGIMTFTSGELENVERELRFATVNDDNDEAELLLWDEVPVDLDVGTTVTIRPGCDRSFDTCRLVHQNLVNFRGYGVFAAGRDRLMAGSTVVNESIKVDNWMTLDELLELQRNIRDSSSGLLD